MSEEPQDQDGIPSKNLDSETPEEGAEENVALEEESTDSSKKEAKEAVEKTPEEEVEDLSDQLLRARAEHENYRKRAAKEKEEAVRFAAGSVLRDLLPSLDSFQMGLQSARAEDENSMIFKGMEMVSRQLEDFFSGQGVTVVDPTGESFDPASHDAMAQEASDEVEEGKIIRVIRAGYVLHDRLLRPANVVVSSGPEAPAEEEDQKPDESEEE